MNLEPGDQYNADGSRLKLKTMDLNIHEIDGMSMAVMRNARKEIRELITEKNGASVLALTRALALLNAEIAMSE